MLYENASRKEPTNEELALQLYFAYGRENNFAKQQTVRFVAMTQHTDGHSSSFCGAGLLSSLQQAMSLYKNWKNVKYLFWSALCMLAQVCLCVLPTHCSF